MAQLSLYIDDAVVNKLSIAAKTLNCSISKYVSTIISRHLSEDEEVEIRKKQILRELRGALDDPSFVESTEIPLKLEIPRRFDLL